MNIHVNMFETNTLDYASHDFVFHSITKPYSGGVNDAMINNTFSLNVDERFDEH